MLIFLEKSDLKVGTGPHFLGRRVFFHLKAVGRWLSLRVQDLHETNVQRPWAAKRRLTKNASVLAQYQSKLIDAHASREISKPLLCCRATILRGNSILVSYV
jgi:hypothetical protein